MTFRKTEYKITVLGSGGVGKTGKVRDEFVLCSSFFFDPHPPPLSSLSFFLVPALTVQMTSSHFVEYYDPSTSSSLLLFPTLNPKPTILNSSPHVF